MEKNNKENHSVSKNKPLKRKYTSPSILRLSTVSQLTEAGITGKHEKLEGGTGHPVSI